MVWIPGAFPVALAAAAPGADGILWPQGHLMKIAATRAIFAASLREKLARCAALCLPPRRCARRRGPGRCGRRHCSRPQRCARRCASRRGRRGCGLMQRQIFGFESLGAIVKLHVPTPDVGSKLHNLANFAIHVSSPMQAPDGNIIADLKRQLARRRRYEVHTDVIVRQLAGGGGAGPWRSRRRRPDWLVRQGLRIPSVSGHHRHR
mmetsp:Transcript_66546/g.215066  ORF Transcript_66546/g.215066 Transcript_66546/m.215066 type:complete len:206 (-) Transcript_66546:231-848(-)